MALGAWGDSTALRIAEGEFRNCLRRPVDPGPLTEVMQILRGDRRHYECRACFRTGDTWVWPLDARAVDDRRLPTQGEYQDIYQVARIERRGEREIEAIQRTLLRMVETFTHCGPEYQDAAAQTDRMIRDVHARIDNEIEQMLYGGNRRYFLGADFAWDAQTNNVPAPPQTMTVADLTAAMQQFPQPTEHDDIIRCYATTMAPLPALHQRDYAPIEPIEHVIDYHRERARLASEKRAKAEVKATALLKSWLSPAQLADFLKTGRFLVTGSAGNLYRIRGDVPSYNVEFCDKHGNHRTNMCFYPQGAPAMGDKMLAQKLTLETDEYEAHAIANLNSPELRLVRPGAVMTTLRAGLPRRSFYEMVFEHLGF